LQALKFKVDEGRVIEFLDRVSRNSYDIDGLKLLRSIPGQEVQIAAALDSWMRKKDAESGVAEKDSSDG
jgi:hypothetical protein